DPVWLRGTTNSRILLNRPMCPPRVLPPGTSRLIIPLGERSFESSCPLPAERNAMRIAIAGFMHESNTFNPLRTDRAAFAAQSLSFGPALLDEWRDAHHEVGGFLEAALKEGFEPVPLVMAWATPSGPVADAVFDDVTGHLVAELRRLRPDGLLLALHGAMVTESYPDADG